MKSTTPICRPFVGLELGQSHEFTALAIVEKTEAHPNVFPVPANTYAIHYLHRFPLGTAYGEIVDHTLALFQQSQLKQGFLIVDETAIGKPIIDLIRQTKLADRMRRLSIIAGGRAEFDGQGSWRVPKKDLVASLQILLESRRLQIADSLPDASLLVKELENFRSKVTWNPTEDALSAWREGNDDDLVFSVAIAIWQGERERWVPNHVPFVFSSDRGYRGGW